MKNLKSAFAWIGCAAFGLSSLACAPYGTVCEDEISCTKPPGNDDENIEICEINWEAAEDKADVKDCTDKFDEYADCFIENAKCENNVFTSSDCTAKAESYNKCMQ